MILSIWTNIWDKLNEWAANFKEFIIENSRNPFMWVIIIIIALIIFEFVFKKLSKD